MTSPALPFAAASLARTTIRLVWFTFVLWALLGGLAGWAAQRSGGGSGGQMLLLLAVFLVLGLPEFRYVTWLGRVRREAATHADQNRVVAWMGWSMIGSALGVFVSGGAVFAAVLGVLGQHPADLGRPDVVAPASAFPELLALTGTLAYARP